MFKNYAYILLSSNHALTERKHHYLKINFFSACMGQWRRNVHWGELHYMLIICESSFWYYSDIALEKMFKVFSPTPKFLTKTRELKEWFLKPEVKWDRGHLTEPREPDGAYLDSNKDREMTMGSHGILFWFCVRDVSGRHLFCGQWCCLPHHIKTWTLL